MARKLRKSRFLKETSQRSGFDNWSYSGPSATKRWDSLKQSGLTLEPVEYDNPPPSKVSLGGADINRTGQRQNYLSTDVPASSAETIHYISAVGGITIPQGWVNRFLIVGSNAAINISADPQIARGTSNQTIAIECIGSSVLLEDGNGLDLRKSFNMDSGAIINLIYKSDDLVWREISRGHEARSDGEL